jgi:hypothetical protein
MRLIFTYILILATISCSTDGLTDFDKEENLIIQATLKETIGTGHFWRSHLSPTFFYPPGHKETTKEKEKFEFYRDSLKILLDTAKIFVFISDSLIRYPATDKKRLIGLINKNHFDKILKIDTSFRLLINEFLEIPERRLIKINELEKVKNFCFVSTQETEKYKQRQSIGKLTISRAAINNSKTKACIYTEIVCGGECGGGQLFFLEKINDVWTVIETQDLWVS